MKNKGLIIFGIFVIAAIIAFAIYKSVSVPNVKVVTSGGSTTNSTNGIGGLLGGSGLLGSIGGFFKGLFGGKSYLPGDSATQTSYGNYE